MESTKQSQKDKIKSLLSDGHWHSFNELNRICYRYSARLLDLKNDGIPHEIKKVSGINYYRITL
jgi:hypothetical protein